MGKPFQKILNWVARKFSEDASQMLIFTGVAGWTLSSLAQLIAIGVNPKIKEEQKVFLVPQEISDAAVNIGSFFLITQMTKGAVSKLFSTGKLAPQKVRNYFKKYPEQYADKIGKLDFNIGEVMKHNKAFPMQEYTRAKSLGTAVATVGASIVASNIITPILRNKMASIVQKTYINEYKSEKTQDKKPNTQPIQPIKTPYPYNNGSMKI